jgi:glycosyltransferase involved in cell wall biosynthesis
VAEFSLNCSRIGQVGGLRSFSSQVMSVVADEAHPTDAVLPDGVSAPAGIHEIRTPQFIGSTSSASLLRPLAWLAYSRFFFPVPSGRRILGTTHHVLPSHKHQIVTVHDLRPYFYPDTPLQKFYFHHLLPRALRNCEGILTVSETSRDLLMEVYGLPESSIRVVPNVIEVREPLPRERANYSDSCVPDYLLMVGASMPHKNADEVLRTHRVWSTRYRLKIVAGGGKYQTSLRMLAKELSISDRVDFYDRVSEVELRTLYANCAAVVYPSKMEGFGLPPLEAMMHGRPAIVADIPIFREIYGEFAHFVKLGDEESWENAYSEIDNFEVNRAESALLHAKSFRRERMVQSLNSALQHFWGVSAQNISN